MRVAILLYDGVDLLDAGGPYEVFLTASRLAVRAGRPAPFAVVTTTVSGGPATAYGGLGLTPQEAVADVGAVDVVVVPGTTDPSGPLGDPELLAAVTTLSGGAGITASVCTGAFLLAHANLLDGRSWTTHWEDIDDLAGVLGNAGAERRRRWVSSKDIVTSGGLSSGIAMALHLVERLTDRDLAERTARQLEYAWEPGGGAPAFDADATAFPGGGSALTTILVVQDPEASVGWYRDVLGAEVSRIYDDSAVLRLFDAWLLLVSAGGPTDDKPGVEMAPPDDPDRVPHAFTIRVENCEAAYRELVDRGAEFLTPPIARPGETRCFFRDPDGHLFEISQA